MFNINDIRIVFDCDECNEHFYAEYTVVKCPNCGKSLHSTKVEVSGNSEEDVNNKIKELVSQLQEAENKHLKFKPNVNKIQEKLKTKNKNLIYNKVI